MATQEVPSGNGIKDISVPRSSAYIKLRRRTEVDCFLVDLFSALQILYQASFRFSPSLCLKFRISFSGDNGEDMRLDMTTSKQTNTRANKSKRAKEANGEREGG